MVSQLGVVVKGPWAAVECVRIPPKTFGPPAAAETGKPVNTGYLDTGYLDTGYLDTLGYPLTTSSDAHYPEHVARRPFELDISAEELQPHGPGTEAGLEALKRALGRRPKS
jgi:hypothetical protein